MDDVLKEIERDRFNSLNDPGIHGIITRLGRLDFVSVAPECCSGHPALDYESLTINIESGEIVEANIRGTIAEEGNFSISLDTSNPKAEKFYIRLREVYAEHSQYSVFFTAHYPKDFPNQVLDTLKIKKGSREFYRPLRFEDHTIIGVAADGKLKGKPTIGETLWITTFSDVKDGNPYEIAEALCRFWQKISNLISGYEKNPIEEILKPYCFGIRNIYGAVVASHPAFVKYKPYLTHTQVFENPKRYGARLK